MKDRMVIVERLAYLVLITGIILDQISTYIVLRFPGGYEGNVFPAWLMSMNLGFLFDLIFIPVSILISHFLYSRLGKVAIAVPIFNIVFGAVRFDAFFHNLYIFSHYIVP